ncbi:MAG: L,D-transpeptidase [Abitibacteriaceae bacterium]|nr:L,D-transpeptidase [Abditibacteriaceae bacterium]
MPKKSLPLRLHHCGLAIIVSAALANVAHAADTQPSVPFAVDRPIDPIAQLPPAPAPYQPAPSLTKDFIIAQLQNGASDSSASTNVVVMGTTTSSTAFQPATGQPVGTPLLDIAHRLKLPLPLPSARIVVTKSQRRLDLFSGQILVKSFPVALGSQPVGPKQSQGDSRTPEGQYYICTRNANNSAFHTFLGLSYPALPDATKAVNNKTISWREYMVIRQRLASRGAPPWGTRLGGWVGIHGGTDGAFAQKKIKERGSKDWTAGCIALTNAEIDEIYKATQLGTPVLVQP